jgi:homogentisate 1,2-dioxygenase
MTKDILEYNYGFNNYHQSEAIKSTLPEAQNSPQRTAHGLYAEQLSGSAFTSPREQTKLTWCYRIQPSVVHSPFEKYDHSTWLSPPFNNEHQSPNQYRWSPEESPKSTNTQNFIDGIKTICGFGNPKNLQGAAASIFTANQKMSSNNCYFSNSDAEMLIILQYGQAVITTELGKLYINQDQDNSDIVVIPRGIRFNIDPLSDYIKGYICENFGQSFNLPELGPIGANGLANPRHFVYPKAFFEENNTNNKTYLWLCKYQGKLWQTHMNHSPCDVVAWHGNYAPYKYNLNLFNTINTVSFDHPDPSIFTVLTSPSGQPGVANIDFAIFPPRWMVAENTFRPPYFHRNIMSEFMGLIKGQYDAKQTGFLPGGISIHNRMAAHGPDFDTVTMAEEKILTPEKYNNTLAFMLESNIAWDVSDYAINSKLLQKDYYQCWQDIPARFKG